ncbi:MAG: RsmE family RNA methyltransferase [Ginsengibacter sp.]
MQLPIFFEKVIPENDSLILSEESSRHISQVLRMKENELIQLTNGVGSLITAKISKPHKNHTEVIVVKRTEMRPLKREVIIAISFIKNAGRFEWFLEKATEIGVTQIIPILCKRTEKSHFRADRMNTILISAMLQSRQVWLPHLKPAIKFHELIDSAAFAQGYIAHCLETDKKDLSDFSSASSDSSIILIGPEGDFTIEEIDYAISNKYTPVTLGETRLRTETAGLVAAVLLTNMK